MKIGIKDKHKGNIKVKISSNILGCEAISKLKRELEGEDILVEDCNQSRFQVQLFLKKDSYNIENEKFNPENVVAYINLELFQNLSEIFKENIGKIRLENDKKISDFFTGIEDIDFGNYLGYDRGGIRFDGCMLILEDVVHLMETMKTSDLNLSLIKSSRKGPIQESGISQSNDGNMAFENLDEFESWLLDLMIDRGIDHTHTQNPKESLIVFRSMVKGLVRSRSKVVYENQLNQLNYKKLSKFSPNLIAMSNKSDRMYIQMLAMIPRISENAAIGIFTHYPSVKKLMEGIKKHESDEEKMKMLEYIQVPLEKGDGLRSLGKSSSMKVFYSFFHLNPDFEI